MEGKNNVNPPAKPNLEYLQSFSLDFFRDLEKRDELPKGVRDVTIGNRNNSSEYTYPRQYNDNQSNIRYDHSRSKNASLKDDSNTDHSQYLIKPNASLSEQNIIGTFDWWEPSYDKKGSISKSNQLDKKLQKPSLPGGVSSPNQDQLSPIRCSFCRRPGTEGVIPQCQHQLCLVCSAAIILKYLRPTALLGRDEDPHFRVLAKTIFSAEPSSIHSPHNNNSLNQHMYPVIAYHDPHILRVNYPIVDSLSANSLLSLRSIHPTYNTLEDIQPNQNKLNKEMNETNSRNPWWYSSHRMRDEYWVNADYMQHDKINKFKQMKRDADKNESSYHPAELTPLSLQCPVCHKSTYLDAKQVQYLISVLYNKDALNPNEWQNLIPMDLADLFCHPNIYGKRKTPYILGHQDSNMMTTGMAYKERFGRLKDYHLSSYGAFNEHKNDYKSHQLGDIREWSDDYQTSLLTDQTKKDNSPLYNFKNTSIPLPHQFHAPLFNGTLCNDLTNNVKRESVSHPYDIHDVVPTFISNNYPISHTPTHCERCGLYTQLTFDQRQQMNCDAQTLLQMKSGSKQYGHTTNDTQIEWELHRLRYIQTLLNYNVLFYCQSCMEYTCISCLKKTHQSTGPSSNHVLYIIDELSEFTPIAPRHYNRFGGPIDAQLVLHIHQAFSEKSELLSVPCSESLTSSGYEINTPEHQLQDTTHDVSQPKQRKNIYTHPQTVFSAARLPRDNTDNTQHQLKSPFIQSSQKYLSLSDSFPSDHDIEIDSTYSNTKYFQTDQTFYSSLPSFINLNTCLQHYTNVISTQYPYRYDRRMIVCGVYPPINVVCFNHKMFYSQFSIHCPQLIFWFMCYESITSQCQYYFRFNVTDNIYFHMLYLMILYHMSTMIPFVVDCMITTNKCPLYRLYHLWDRQRKKILYDIFNTVTLLLIHHWSLLNKSIKQFIYTADNDYTISTHEDIGLNYLHHQLDDHSDIAYLTNSDTEYSPLLQPSLFQSSINLQASIPETVSDINPESLLRFPTPFSHDIIDFESPLKPHYTDTIFDSTVLHEKLYDSSLCSSNNRHIPSKNNMGNVHKTDQQTVYTTHSSLKLSRLNPYVSHPTGPILTTQRTIDEIQQATGYPVPKDSDIFPFIKKNITDFRCPQHPQEPIHFFCLHCETSCFCGCCCADQIHAGHDISSVNDGWDIIKHTALQKDIQPCFERLLQDTFMLEPAIHEMRKTYMDQVNNTKETIEYSLSHIVEMMQNSEKEILADIQIIQESINHSFEQHLKDVDKCLKELTELNDSLRVNKNTHDDATICEFYHDIIFLKNEDYQTYLDKHYTYGFNQTAAFFKDRLQYFSETLNTQFSVLDQISMISRTIGTEYITVTEGLSEGICSTTDDKKLSSIKPGDWEKFKNEIESYQLHISKMPADTGTQTIVLGYQVGPCISKNETTNELQLPRQEVSNTLDKKVDALGADKVYGSSNRITHNFGYDK